MWAVEWSRASECERRRSEGSWVGDERCEPHRIPPIPPHTPSRRTCPPYPPYPTPIPPIPHVSPNPVPPTSTVPLNAATHPRHRHPTILLPPPHHRYHLHRPPPTPPPQLTHSTSRDYYPIMQVLPASNPTGAPGKANYIIITNFDFFWNDAREWFDPTGEHPLLSSPPLPSPLLFLYLSLMWYPSIHLSDDILID